jgi:hypothetical protein
MLSQIDIFALKKTFNFFSHLYCKRIFFNLEICPYPSHEHMTFLGGFYKAYVLQIAMNVFVTLHLDNECI